MKLIDELYAQGRVNEEQKNELEGQLKTTGKTEEEVILENNIIPEIALFELKSKIVGVPFMKLPQQEIPLDIFE